RHTLLLRDHIQLEYHLRVLGVDEEHDGRLVFSESHRRVGCVRFYGPHAIAVDSVERAQPVPCRLVLGEGFRGDVEPRVRAVREEQRRESVEAWVATAPNLEVVRNREARHEMYLAAEHLVDRARPSAVLTEDADCALVLVRI